MLFTPETRATLDFTHLSLSEITVVDHDNVYDKPLDHLLFAACMVYAAEIASTGGIPLFANASGVFSVCYNSSIYAQALQNMTIQQPHIRILRILSPYTIRWATVVACVLALLMAV